MCSHSQEVEFDSQHYHIKLLIGPMVVALGINFSYFLYYDVPYAEEHLDCYAFFLCHWLGHTIWKMNESLKQFGLHIVSYECMVRKLNLALDSWLARINELFKQ